MLAHLKKGGEERGEKDREERRDIGGERREEREERRGKRKERK